MQFPVPTATPPPVRRSEPVAPGARLAAQDRLTLEEAEHQANTLRFRAVASLGVGMWLALLGLDALMATVVYPGRFWWYAVIRLGVFPWLVYAVAQTYRGITPWQLKVVEHITFAFVSLGIALMCLESGGMRSLYYAGIMVAMVARGVTIAEPWRDSLVIHGVFVFGYPGALALGAWLKPEIAAQWTDPSSVAAMLVGTGLIACTSIMSLLGANEQWRLRRTMFERRTIGRYTLIERIGTGGMGEVWRAANPQFRQDVALKLLRADNDNARAMARFEREAEALSRLSHPNTVRVYDYGTSLDGVAYFAMEFLRGEDLKRVLLREGALSPRRAVSVAVQVAGALAEAHRVGICHRDIKPGNLFVLDTGTDGLHIKVLDFGIASADEDDSVTRTGTILGTPSYLSPEAARGQRVGPTADVYAIGVLLFHMVCGAPPFQRGSVAATLLAHQQDDVPPMAVYTHSGVSHGLEQIIRRCLAKAADARYPDCGALHEALANLDAASLGSMPVATFERGGSEPTVEQSLGLYSMTPPG